MVLLSACVSISRLVYCVQIIIDDEKAVLCDLVKVSMLPWMGQLFDISVHMTAIHTYVYQKQYSVWTNLQTKHVPNISDDFCIINL